MEQQSFILLNQYMYIYIRIHNNSKCPFKAQIYLDMLTFRIKQIKALGSSAITGSPKLDSKREWNLKRILIEKTRTFQGSTLKMSQSRLVGETWR